MKSISPILLINKLVLVGHEKEYCVPFYPGVNIIYGDSDTGKSSILNLIDYLLGSKKVYMYEEIEKNGKYALLEVNLNGSVYTIKRDIFKPDELIEVYSTSIENMSELFPALYGPNYQKVGPAGYFSDFLLNALNIPLVKIKQAPSKMDSDLSRLSFRDIFKFNYLDQDDVGNRNILDSGNFSVFTKNKETFKFLHNLLDSQITDLQGQISEKTNEKNKLLESYQVISTFFKDTNIKTLETLSDDLAEYKQEVEHINREIQSINTQMRSDNAYFNDLRNLIIRLESELKLDTEAKSLKLAQLEQHVRLKKDYQQDIDKLESSLAIIKRLPEHKEEVDCPICSSKIEYTKLALNFEKNNSETVKLEIKSIKNRLKELETLIDTERNNIVSIEAEENHKNENLKKARQMLDIEAKEFVSPFIAQRDELVAEKATVIEKINKVEYLIKLRKQLNEIITKSNHLSEQIRQLTEKLDQLKAGAPSIEGVLSNIGSSLELFLKAIPIRKPYGISISEKNFLPVVRDRNYSELTSGGLRTLVSVGYILSLLQNSLNNSSNFPSIVMIDTIGKYLGKTKSGNDSIEGNTNEEILEGLDDPSKVINLYSFVTNLSEKFLEKDKLHQILIIDNDLPVELEVMVHLQKYVVKYFNVQGKNGGSVGFIDNA
ncbi:hypothetical protein J31TS6_61720 [Brevibacillus reuszeri]|uniref:AAA family ATPase n=1 Tax=Brevibacillus reuszeri TaxID=54915 RepID=UPI001B2A561F|nr:AAA family ATPase [Brevibacillus reuszeri]GIO10144.1 hypothetical protein J31TS6_61720 [Brevibacillus reuszeri]